MKQDAADNSIPREISALLSNERLILRETQRAVTPLGGVAVFVAFLHKLGFVEKLRRHMPIQWKSPTTSIPRQPSSRFSWPCCQTAEEVADGVVNGKAGQAQVMNSYSKYLRYTLLGNTDPFDRAWSLRADQASLESVASSNSQCW